VKGIQRMVRNMRNLYTFLRRLSQQKAFTP